LAVVEVVEVVARVCTGHLTACCLVVAVAVVMVGSGGSGGGGAVSVALVETP
jgi:hypothetical protein